VARKTKGKKVNARKSKVRTKRTSAPSVTPTYLREGQTYTMGLHAVVRVLKVIEKHGHMAKFVRAAKDQQAAGTFDAETVNFVKDFMVKQKMHNDPIGKHIVNAQQGEPTRGATRGGGRFNCNFG
jgi:ribosomal protein L28